MSEVTDHLSALDTSFLAAERPGVPLHIGGIARFEGGPLLDEHGRLRIDEIRQLVDAHLVGVPRFRRRLQPAPLLATLPLWVDDEHFDIGRHVRAATVPPPGDDATMLELAMAIQAEPIDRDHPLWELTFLDGLADGSVVLVDKTHHALADGVSGSESLIAILDPDPAARLPVPPRWEARPAPGAGERLTEALHSLLHLPVDAVRQTRMLARSPAELRTLLSTVADVVREEVTAPRCSLNAPVGPRRSHTSVGWPLADVKRIAHTTETKVNDVVLAVVTGGLCALLEQRGELTGPGALDHVTALVPVSTRGADDPLGHGNQVSGILAHLPVGVTDPRRCLDTVSRRMTAHKQSHESELLAAVLGSANWLPPLLLTVLSDLSVNRQPLVNLVVTNVPGAQVPLYLLGARMTEFLPYVPLGGNTTVGVAILSYDGQLSVGVTSDPDTCPDVEVLMAGMQERFDTLLAAA